MIGGELGLALRKLMLPFRADMTLYTCTVAAKDEQTGETVEKVFDVVACDEEEAMEIAGVTFDRREGLSQSVNEMNKSMISMPRPIQGTKRAITRAGTNSLPTGTGTLLKRAWRSLINATNSRDPIQVENLPPDLRRKYLHVCILSTLLWAIISSTGVVFLVTGLQTTRAPSSLIGVNGYTVGGIGLTLCGVIHLVKSIRDLGRLTKGGTDTC